METSHKVGIAVAGLAVGVGAFAVTRHYRHKNLDPGASPMPIFASLPAGADKGALEVDAKGNTVLRNVPPEPMVPGVVYESPASQLLKAIGDRWELALLPDDAGNPRHADVPGAFNLAGKGATPGAMYAGHAASKWLAAAAAAGFDVLVNLRVTKLLEAGAMIVGPTAPHGWLTADVLVSASPAETHVLASPSGRTVDEKFAVLVYGDQAIQAAARVLPPPPGGFPGGEQAKTEIEKQIKAAGAMVVGAPWHEAASVESRLAAMYGNRPWFRGVRTRASARAGAHVVAHVAPGCEGFLPPFYGGVRVWSLAI